MKRLFAILFIFLFCSSVLAANRITFYSVSPVGTSTDLKTGSPNITISNGVATLSVAQTGNIGAGCRIEYNSTHCYIAPNRIGFDSGGTVEIKIGDKIEGTTSGATGIVRAVKIDSGSWSSGNAAGYIYFEKTNGTWQDNEQINRVKPTVSNDVATINGTLQGNIGNGNTQFVVLTATGGTPSNQTSTPVTAIYHEYASLNAWGSGFTDSNHLNTTDLTINNDITFACCYYDHIDNTPGGRTYCYLNGVTTSEDAYEYIYTPIGGAESINRQRHDGVYTTEDCFYYDTNGDYQYIKTTEDYTVIEGLQYYQSPYSNDYVLIENATNVTIRDCILKGSTGSNEGLLRIKGSSVKAINNIIYDAYLGIKCDYPVADTLLYNNTVVDSSTGIDVVAGSAANVHVKNNLVNDCSPDYESVTFNSDHTNNISKDASSPDSSFRNKDADFNDQSNDDYTLSSTDTQARDEGIDLTSDTNYAFWRDISGDERGNSWDIGADEYITSGSTYVVDGITTITIDEITISGVQ